MAIHKGTELNNVKETWQQNERSKEAGSINGNEDAADQSTVSDEVKQAIKEEAAEYDNANKADRIMDGDRATINEHPGKKNT